MAYILANVLTFYVTWMHVYVCMYIYVCICMYMYVYVCICMYMYVYCESEILSDMYSLLVLG
jgi:hypothetical protein